MNLTQVAITFAVLLGLAVVMHLIQATGWRAAHTVTNAEYALTMLGELVFFIIVLHALW